MRILRENTAALIIDIQERLFPHIQEKESLLERNTVLVKGLGELKIPTLLAQIYTKGLGPTIPPLLEVLPVKTHLEKISFSCLDEPSIKEALTNVDKKFIIIAGIEAHVCVMQTVLDLLDNGYIPVVIEDCVSSRKKQDKLTAINRMRSSGALISTAESVLFELCRYSGSAEFKAISALVK